MSEAERLSANTKFLDRGIAAGEKFLSMRISEVLAGKGSWLKYEVQYLLNAGYQVAADGSTLIPPR